jgi:hypothetical protein
LRTPSRTVLPEDLICFATAARIVTSFSLSSSSIFLIADAGPAPSSLRTFSIARSRARIASWRGLSARGLRGFGASSSGFASLTRTMGASFVARMLFAR